MNINTIQTDKAMASLLQFCLEKQLTVSLAESVTGGRLSSAFTALPGSSKILKEGIVCYSPESKQFRLHIKNEMMQTCGLVSSEVTLHMAKQVRKSLKTDIGMATTGNAGPEANDNHAVVGQAYIAISTKNKEVILPKFYHGSRNQIQNAITRDAIRSLYYVLLEGVI